MSDDLVLYEQRDATALITLNRPEAMNPLNLPMIEALDSAVIRAERDPAIRVIVFTGAGD